MAKRDIFNRRMQHILRLSDEHTPLIKTIQKNSLAATRCQLDMPFDTGRRLYDRHTDTRKKFPRTLVGR